MLQVCPSQPITCHRSQKRNQNTCPSLDCLHYWIPNMVICFSFYYVWLWYHSRFCSWCRYCPTVQLYHHDQVPQDFYPKKDLSVPKSPKIVTKNLLKLNCSIFSVLIVLCWWSFPSTKKWWPKLSKRSL